MSAVRELVAEDKLEKYFVILVVFFVFCTYNKSVIMKHKTPIKM